MADKNKIRELRASGLSYFKIAQIVGLSYTRVNQICSEKARERQKAYGAKYQREHLSETHAKTSRYYWKRKIEALTHYGNGKCACVKCGFNDPRALSIDHINGKGYEHRKEIRMENIYTWLYKNNFPDGFQTLCMNCQFIKKNTNYEFPSRHPKEIHPQPSFF